MDLFNRNLIFIFNIHVKTNTKRLEILSSLSNFEAFEDIFLI